MKRSSLALALVALVAHRAAADEPAVPAPVEPARPVEPAPVAPEPASPPTDTPAAKPAEPPAGTAEPKYKRVRVTATTLQRSGMSFDLTLAGGVTVLHGNDDETRLFFGRVRGGLLIYNEPNFLILGLAGQYSPLHSTSLGIEVQYIDLWRGTWIQAGVFPLDTTHGVSIEGSVGYALLGVEYQRRLSGARSSDQSLVLSLHIPLGVVQAVRKPVPGVIVLPPSAMPATAER